MKHVKRPKCVQCEKKPGRLPPGPHYKPMYCSLACIYAHLSETSMDWDRCPGCGWWRDMQYECRNDEHCPTRKEPEDDPSDEENEAAGLE